MFVRNRSNRFSLLLLDEGEYYFDDFSVTYYPFARTDEQSILKYDERQQSINQSILLLLMDWQVLIRSLCAHAVNEKVD
jgi:hypothetical protein